MALGMRKQKLIKNIVFYFFLILIICVLDFPIYWMIKCSFTDVDQIMTRDVSGFLSLILPRKNIPTT